MRYLTARKQAIGLGAARRGAERQWSMAISSAMLLVLVPLFVFSIGPLIGRPYQEVTAALGQPFRAIVAGLTMTIGLIHFRAGVQVMLEDYVHGLAREISLMAMSLITWAAIGATLFALVKLAL